MKNFDQKHEIDYAKEKVRPEVEEEVHLILIDFFTKIIIFKQKIKKVVDEMIMIYLDNLRTTKVKNAKKKIKGTKNKQLKLPGLLAVNKKDPRDLLGEVLYLSFRN